MRASDLVGCRFRQRQRRAHPDVPELPEALIRQTREAAAGFIASGVDPDASIGEVLEALYASKVSVLDHQYIGLPEITAMAEVQENTTA